MIDDKVAADQRGPGARVNLEFIQSAVYNRRSTRRSAANPR
jgi:hypothetical protein